MLGSLAYALFFAYDWMNVRHPEVRVASALFPIGVILVAVATAILIAGSAHLVALTVNFLLGLIVAVASFAATVWALVFSLPKNTYSEPGQRRPVYEGGAYALCRHPGVFFYCCFYVGLLIALPCFANLVGFAVLCAGNIAYMILQDVWTFPEVLAGYDDYKKRSNMFLPRFAGRSGDK